MSEMVQQYSDECWLATGGGKLLVYIGPNIRENLNEASVRQVVARKKAIGAMWNYDYDCGDEGPWYQYVCDDPDYDIANIKSKKGRYYVRRSLEKCVVQKIEKEFLIEKGYELYLKASSRYVDFTPLSAESYKKDFGDACLKRGRIPMGVFIENNFAAFATVYLRGSSLRVATAFFDPAYSESYPMYALYYTIVKEFLGKDGCTEVNNGSRPLLHETNIGDFLIRLGWRKAYCRLGLYLPNYILFILALAGWTGIIWKNCLPSRYTRIIKALLEARKTAEVTRKP